MIVTLYASTAGVTVDAYRLLREQLIAARPNLLVLGDWLRTLERCVLIGWSIGGDLQLGSNLLLGRIRRSRFPALFAGAAQQPLYREFAAHLAGVPFTSQKFDEMRAWLATVARAGELAMQLVSLCLAELRLWIVFAVMRALSITLNRLEGRPETIPCSVDLLTQAEHRAFFRQQDSIALGLDHGEFTLL